MNIQFNSTLYKPIFWKNIFEAAGIAFAPEKNPIGLMNNRGLVMASDAALNASNCTLISLEKILDIAMRDLNVVPMPLLEQSGMVLFRLKNKLSNNTEKTSDHYFNFINRLLYHSYQACYEIFLYTRDHLSSRYYGEMKIAHIDQVHFIFSDIIVLLKSLDAHILKIKTIEQIDFVISQLLEINKHLSKLGGARAVLKGNVVDFSFHLLFFRNFIQE